MRILLDTHVFLWWRLDAPELSARARRLISDSGNRVYVSAAVAWEIVIKRSLGRLLFEGDVGAAIADEAFEPLPITVEHTDALADLPMLHRDPFDRVQIAQAQTEGLTLVTHDDLIRRYEDVSLFVV